MKVIISSDAEYLLQRGPRDIFDMRERFFKFGKCTQAHIKKNNFNLYI